MCEISISDSVCLKILSKDKPDNKNTSMIDLSLYLTKLNNAINDIANRGITNRIVNLACNVANMIEKYMTCYNHNYARGSDFIHTIDFTYEYSSFIRWGLRQLRDSDFELLDSNDYAMIEQTLTSLDYILWCKAAEEYKDVPKFESDEQ